VTWSQSNSPTCDLCDADDVQDEQHVLFHCDANPHVISFRKKYAPLFLFLDLPDVIRSVARFRLRVHSL